VGYLAAEQQLETRLIYGFYPEVINQMGRAIDYLEEYDGTIHACEFKWNPKASFKFPKSFMETYQATAKKIDRENFREFVCG
jgi:hypothetical protein